MGRLNRFFLAILIGLFLYLAYGGFLIALNWRHIADDPAAMSQELLTNFISDAVFFGLVGVVGVIAQFYADHGDVLQQRLRKVFANRRVELPVIDFFEEIARANAVYAAHAEHVISVLDFREDLFAYRGEFRNVYHLRNAFGDIPYDALLTVKVAPDLARGDVTPLAVVTRLQLTVGKDTKSFLTAPIKVDKDGFKQTIRVTVPKSGEAVLEMNWWSWIDAAGDWDSGFSLKRFAERFTVRVENRAPVKVAVAREKSGPGIEIEYGSDLSICDEANVAPLTRFEFFWRPPEGKAPAPGVTRGDASTGLLDFDTRLGDAPVNEL